MRTRVVRPARCLTTPIDAQSSRCSTVSLAREAHNLARNPELVGQQVYNRLQCEEEHLTCPTPGCGLALRVTSFVLANLTEVWWLAGRRDG